VLECPSPPGSNNALQLDIVRRRSEFAQLRLTSFQMAGSLRTLVASIALLVVASACHDSPTEPAQPTPTPASTPTRVPTPTPTPVPAGPAGIFGFACATNSHTPCEGFIPGATISITQGSVHLQAVSSATDGSFTFPVGGGLVGPNSCTVSATAPAVYGLVPLEFSFHLNPGPNQLIITWGPGFP
jgi:hypothetical protein